MEAVYKSISKRINMQAWEELLEDEVCAGLDTEEMARERLLVLLMKYCNIPHVIWARLDERFGFEADREELCEKFPRNFIEFVINQSKYEDFVDYELFYGPDDGNYDDLINEIFKLKDLCDDIEGQDGENRDFGEIDQEIENVRKMQTGHPFVDVIRMQVCMFKNQMDDAREICDALRNGFGELTGKDYMDNIYICYSVSRVLDAAGDTQQAFELRQKVLEQMPNHKMALLDDLKYYYDKGEYCAVKEKSIDFLDEFGNYPQALEYMRLSNEKVMDELKTKADDGDMESLYDLGWCYFQNERYDECIELISRNVPGRDDKYEFEYMNLAGRCLAGMGKFKGALGRLIRWREILYSLEDDGSDKYQKRIKRKGYSNYVIGMCYYNIWEERKDHPADLQKMENESDISDDELLDRSIEALLAGIEEEKDFKEKVYYRDRLAFVYLKAKQFEKCIDVCTELIKEIPQYYSAYVMRQEAYYKLDYPKEVIDDHYEAVRYYKQDARTYELTAEVFYNYRQYDDMRSVLEAARENGAVSDQLELLEIQCEWKESLDDDDSSAKMNECLEKLCRMEKNIIEDEKQDSTLEDKADIYYISGLIYLNLYEREKGFAYLDKAVKVNPEKLVDVYRVKATVYNSARETGKELNVLKELHKIDGGSVETVFRMGRCYWLLDEDDKAKEAYDEVYEKEPDHNYINTNLADYYMYMYRQTLDLQMYEKCIFHAKKQCEIDTRPYYYFVLGQNYWERYDFENAKAVFDKVLNEDETFVDVYYYYAKMSMVQGDFKQGYEYAMKAVNEMERLNVSTQRIYTYVIYDAAIDCCIALGDRGQALKLVEMGKKSGDSTDDWYLDRKKRVYECDQMKDIRRKFLLRRISDATGKVKRAKCVSDMAVFEFECGNFREGSKRFKEALELAKGDEDAQNEIYLDMADAYYEDKADYKKAMKYGQIFLDSHRSGDRFRMLLYMAAYAAECGNMKKSKKYFDEFVKECNEKYGGVYEGYINVPIYARARLFNLGIYYKAIGDKSGLAKCIELMRGNKLCQTCNYGRCYELYILLGMQCMLNGDRQGAIDNFKIANEANNNGIYTRNLLVQAGWKEE